MDVATIAVDPDEVRKLHADYKSQVHYETDVDREIRQVYAVIEKGKTIIQGAGSVVAAGVNADGLPKLALTKANARECFLHIESNYGRPQDYPNQMVRMSHTQTGAWGRSGHQRFAWLLSDWRGIKDTSRSSATHHAPMPLIPVHLRPKVALAAYHVMWEAEWSRIVPKDPYLLRRIGKSDLFVVVAAWDLTEVERAVLQSRIAVN